MFGSSTQVQSLPSLPVHAFVPMFNIQDKQRDNHDFHGSASYTNLPGVPVDSPSIQRTFSENVLSSLADAPSAAAAAATPSISNANLEMFRRTSNKTKKRAPAARLVSSSNVGHAVEEPEKDYTKHSRNAPGMLKMFAKKPLPAQTRPNSPLRTGVRLPSPAEKEERSISPVRLSMRPGRAMARPDPVDRRSSPRDSAPADDVAVRRGRREDDTPSIRNGNSPTPTWKSQSENSSEMNSEVASSRTEVSRRSSFSSLRSRASTDRMFLAVPHKIPPMPTISSDRLSQWNHQANKAKDPQWIQFRQLDGEETSFRAKTGLQKAKTIRTVVLPFFNKNTDHSALHLLRPEDLARRIGILNKWWMGLLELLNGPQQQSVSSTDRPAFLDVISEIMLRPEWRIPPTKTVPDASKRRASMVKTDSNTSTDSDESEFVISSVHQNIRNTFIHNLQQQMEYVVDKMSMRTAPASLVSFAGKTCAYAFVFCPGMADTLAQLWHIPPGTLRRVFAEYGPENSRRAGALSQVLAKSFPAPLRSLAFTSHAALSRHLQQKVQSPPGCGDIRWGGPWVNRWIGRDSDLFFVFVKHYHILVSEYLPRSLMPDDRLAIPGLVVVHAQLMLNLETTLYRQTGHIQTDPYAAEAPDSMAPLPMLIPNATRTITENRIVILLREIANDPRPRFKPVAELMVGSFQYILKAATRKISMYNNDACFVLCELLEELLPIVSRFQRTHTESEDWDFWLSVFKQVMQTQTTMTQMRVIAFVYSMWNILASTEQRKRQMVLEWLLVPSFFNAYFNHWSPMVRHYFYRLLCWRVGRCDGQATETDIEIYQAMQKRLHACHAHHAYLTADAEMRGISPPSIVPCTPAPGRVLLIIRTDQSNVNRGFTSFDRLTSTNYPYITSSATPVKAPEAQASDLNAHKKKWSLLKSISLFSGPANSRPGEVTPPRSPTMSPTDKKDSHKTADGTSRPATPPHEKLSFRFSLEHSNNRPQLPSKSRRVANPSLPHTSQRVLDDLEMAERVSTSTSSSSSHDKHWSGREIQPQKPPPEEQNAARYSGRALAEWSQVVLECRNFYTRRKQEGCPKDAAVETPVMAVESFRMFG